MRPCLDARPNWASNSCRKWSVETILIRDLSTDKTKREMFGRLHEHFNKLADEVETAIKSANGS
jgi:hypothetical protein